MTTEKSTTAASYAGAAVSVGSSLTLTEIGIIVGIVTALATFALNWWFQWRRDKREEREHILRAADLREELRERRQHNVGHSPERRK